MNKASMEFKNYIKSKQNIVSNSKKYFSGMRNSMRADYLKLRTPININKYKFKIYKNIDNYVGNFLSSSIIAIEGTDIVNDGLSKLNKGNILNDIDNRYKYMRDLCTHLTTLYSEDYLEAKKSNYISEKFCNKYKSYSDYCYNYCINLL